MNTVIYTILTTNIAHDASNFYSGTRTIVFYFHRIQRKKKKTPQIMYLIFNSHGRYFEILALRDRDLRSLNTLGRIHVFQLLCLKSKHATENLENYLRPDSPHVTVLSIQ